MADDRFLWKEDDLTIEHPIGSGHFIPLREFNKLVAAEREKEKAEKVSDESKTNTVNNLG